MRWVLLAFVCLAAVMWLVTCEGAGERTVVEEQPAVEEQPVAEVQPELEETPVAEAEPTVAEEPVVGEQPSAEVMACLATGTEKNLVERAAKVLADYSYLFDRYPYWLGAEAVYLTAEHHDDPAARDEEEEKRWERIRGPQDSGIAFNYGRDRRDRVNLLTITDEDGETQAAVGIVVLFREWAGVDQSRLSPEHRIPDCLEGVPVQLLRARHYTTY